MTLKKEGNDRKYWVQVKAFCLIDKNNFKLLKNKNLKYLLCDGQLILCSFVCVKCFKKKLDC